MFEVAADHRAFFAVESRVDFYWMRRRVLCLRCLSTLVVLFLAVKGPISLHVYRIHSPLVFEQQKVPRDEKRPLTLHFLCLLDFSETCAKMSTSENQLFMMSQRELVLLLGK